MKRKLMRAALLGLALVLVLSLFAGCGAKEAEPKDQPAGTLKETETTTAEPEKKVELKFNHYQVEVADKFQTIIDGFQKENPNITVKMDAVPTKDWNNVISMRLASGEDLDLLGVHPVPDMRKSYPVVLESGALMDLTNESVLGQWGDIFTEDTRQDGKVIAIPTSVNAYVVFYNKNLFKELQIEVPKTWSEFIAACDKIKAAGIVPFAHGAKDGWPVGMWEIGLQPTILGHKDPTFDFYKKLVTGESSYSSPEYLEIFTKFQQLSKYMNENALGVGYNEAPVLFVSKKAAMLPDGSWTAGQISSAKPEFEVGAFLMPGSDTVMPSTVPVKYGLCLAVAAKTKNKAESLKFIEYFTKKEVYSDFVTSQKLLPTQKGITFDDPLMMEVAKLMESGKNQSFCTNVWPKGIKLANRFTAWQKLYLGEYTPQQAAEHYMKDVAEDVKNIGK